MGGMKGKERKRRGRRRQEGRRGPLYVNDFFMEALNPVFYLIRVTVALVAFSKVTKVMLHSFFYFIKLEV